MRERSLLALASFLLAAACSGGGGGQQPSWRHTTPEGQPQPVPKESPAFVELAETETQVSKYNDPPIQSALDSALSLAIVELFEEGSAAAGLPAPVRDGRLYRALAELAAVAPLETTPAYPLIEFALQRNGIIEPSPHLVIIQGDIDHPESIVEQLRPSVAEVVATGTFERIGVGAARRGDVDVVLVALQESNLTTKPISRELVEGGAMPIEGTLGPGFSQPHAFHTDDSGAVNELAVARFGANGFRTLFSCEGHHGRQQVEITASDASGSTVLANFPVWCGEPAPRSLRVAKESAEPVPASRGEAEERMVELVNRDRAAHNLPPLKVDPRVTEVARRYSDEMLSTGKVGHVSPISGSASDRVKAGGVRTAVILENVARGYGVAAAQQGLMNSPGHRANILSKDVSHIGIGITLGQEVAGRRELLVTQVFTYVPGPIDSGDVRSQVAAKIQSIKPMTANSELRQVAQVFAAELARGVSTEQASKNATKSLDTKARGFARVSTLVTAVANVEAFDPTDALGGAQVSHHGIGIAQGEHPVMGEGAIYIVVLLGQK